MNHYEKNDLDNEILKSEEIISEAALMLEQLDDMLRDFCDEICASLGFDFAGISLISYEEDTIEAIYGKGRAKEWAGRAKHSLKAEPKLQDIQAYIVNTKKTEIISGPDPRFDDWIYEEFRHHELVRIYTPILIIQGEHGEVVKDWFKDCQWEERDTNLSEREGQHKVFSMKLLKRVGEVKVIGTLEVGYEERNKEISEQKIYELTKIVAEKAPSIWQVQLPGVLEVITKEARKIMKADFATFHFLYHEKHNKYTYEVYSGLSGKKFLHKCKPRKDGMGRKAIIEQRSQYIPDIKHLDPKMHTIETANPSASEVGIKAMAAYPLRGDRIDLDCREEDCPIKEGVLYVATKTYQPKKFSRDHLDSLGHYFVRCAYEAIQKTISELEKRDRERQLESLNSIMQSFTLMQEDGDLLRCIASNTLNILGADVVTIYEYLEDEKQFLAPPTIAGRLKDINLMHWEIRKNDVPSKLLKHGINGSPQFLESPVFKDSSFTKREEIKSAVGILLKVEKEVVGAMFINYRWSHYFSDINKESLKGLSSSSATAIKNRRTAIFSSKFNQNFKQKILTTLNHENLLNLVIQKAIELTKADCGWIYLHESQNILQLIEKSKNSYIASQLSINQKDIDNRKIVIDKVLSERHSFFTETIHVGTKDTLDSASMINIRLLDENNNSIIGVFSVESKRTKAFDWRSFWLMKNLATLTVDCIQNIQNKERKIDELTIPLIHRINNDLGMISKWAKSIVNDGDESSKKTAEQILSKTNKVLQDKDYLIKSWLSDEANSLDLKIIISHALERVTMPDMINANINISSNLPNVFGDHQKLLDVFINIIQNAIDAMKDGGHLTIIAKPINLDSESWAEVKICDTGIGIVKDNLDTIFQGGFTTKNSMGIGLKLARAYIENMGGDIAVSSERENGSVFTVVLPGYKPII
jgi:nitrogen-specific signal transduction histidine kinase